MTLTTPTSSTDIWATIAAARWDIPLFARALFGIDLHPSQVEFVEAIITRLEDGVSPAYLTVCCSAGNRAGKTLGLAIAVMHSTLYKHGIRPPWPGDDSDARRWSDAPYDWYHFALAQDTSELVLLEISRMLMGIHPAQKGRGCPMTDVLGLDVAEWDRKERGEWGWFKWNELFGGAEIHFRTTAEKALGTLGRDMAGWSWDEAAFDPNLLFVFDEVLNLRRMSTGGQAVLISTATEGSQDYEDIWRRGDPLAPDRQPDYFSLRMSTRSNVGFGISEHMFERMLRTVPPTLVPQNIDGQFIEGRAQFFATEAVNRTFSTTLPAHAEWEPRRLYVMGVDPALTYDSTWAVVLDITDPDRWVGVRVERRSGRQTAEGIVLLAAEVYQEYARGGRLTCGIDATGFGGKMFRSLLQSSRIPATPIEFGGRTAVKGRMLQNLRTALESGRLALPLSGPWITMRRQLLGYKLADRKLDTDAVMALVIAVRMAARALGNESVPVTFDYFGSLDLPSPTVVPSGQHEPHSVVDDRVLRLDSLASASVASLRIGSRRG